MQGHALYTGEILCQAADNHVDDQLLTIICWVALAPLVERCIDFVDDVGPDANLANVVANKGT